MKCGYREGSIRVLWTDEKLRRYISQSKSVDDVLLLLGKAGNTAASKVRKFISTNNIDISHWTPKPVRNGDKYTYNIDAFTNEGTISFYLLGAFMTDGSIQIVNDDQMSCKLDSKDEDWLMLIRDIICPGRPLYKDKNCYRLVISNTSICRWLISWGCGPRKSLTLNMPAVPKHLLPDFIRGVIDGDGHIGTTKGSTQVREHTRIQITTASSNFAEGLSTSLSMEGFSNSIGKEFARNKKPHLVRGVLLTPKHDTYSVRILSNSISPLLEWAYYTRNPLAMPRKQIAAYRGIANRSSMKKPGWKLRRPTS